MDTHLAELSTSRPRPNRPGCICHSARRSGVHATWLDTAEITTVAS
ncbi:hypothetical protein [Streptomyces sp. MMG1533]|nr:hypothetical protein [Streptomyces sp. MMG1533]